MRTESSEDLVTAAQAGDREARERLISDCLPLVYNIIGRALGGHVDVDDLVQETLLRVIDGLGGLRDPSRFRSWLVAIAMNQVRRRWSTTKKRPVVGLDAVPEISDPAADFVDLTILRLGLSGQRREIAEATRWLDSGDRELLALWWLETSGELNRSELAAVLERSRQHVAVQVQRMKEQLDAGRTVVRVLNADPRCEGLSKLIVRWDGRPAPVWRKRILRHIRDCRICSEHRNGLVPAEALLASLALVPPPPDIGFAFLHTGPRTAARNLSRPRLRGSGPAWAGAVMGTAAVTVFAVLVWSIYRSPDQEPAPKLMLAGPTSVPRTSPPAPKHRSPAMRGSVRRVHNSPRSVEQQVVSLANAQRAKNGCDPLHVDARLHIAAQKHSDDMATRHFFDHTNPDAKGPGDRITAAGYRWGAWAENIAVGQQNPSDVMNSWMNSPGHRANILNCGYKDIGVGVARGRGGPWWTQDFATP
jgi:RNA polymerase sigma factor (sigma-70 family)